MVMLLNFIVTPLNFTTTPLNYYDATQLHYDATQTYYDLWYPACLTRSGLSSTALLFVSPPLCSCFVPATEHLPSNPCSDILYGRQRCTCLTCTRLSLFPHLAITWHHLALTGPPLPSLDITCPPLPPRALHCPHLPSLALPCHHLPSLALPCHHLPSLALPCLHLPSLALTCPHLPSLSLSCPHLPSLALTRPQSLQRHLVLEATLAIGRLSSLTRLESEMLPKCMLLNVRTTRAPLTPRRFRPGPTAAFASPAPRRQRHEYGEGEVPVNYSPLSLPEVVDGVHLAVEHPTLELFSLHGHRGTLYSKVLSLSLLEPSHYGDHSHTYTGVWLL